MAKKKNRELKIESVTIELASPTEKTTVELKIPREFLNKFETKTGIYPTAEYMILKDKVEHQLREMHFRLNTIEINNKKKWWQFWK